MTLSHYLIALLLITALLFVLLVRESRQTRRLLTALQNANQVLRSCWHVTKREGETTDWPALRRGINATLSQQYRLLASHNTDDGSPENCQSIKLYLTGDLPKIAKP